jgi:hypothetical protein
MIGGNLAWRIGKGAVVAVVVVGLAAGSARADLVGVGCSADMRSRLGQATYEGAQNAINISVGVHRMPGATIDNCVGALIRKLSMFKLLSGNLSFSFLLDQLLSALEQKACQLLTEKVGGMLSEVFDPVAFLQSKIPVGMPVTIQTGGSVPGGSGGWGNVTATVPAVDLPAIGAQVGGTVGGFTDKVRDFLSQ